MPDATVRLVFGADTAQAEAAIGKVKSQLGDLGSAFTLTGATLTAAFTAPTVGLIKLASTFDDAMDKIRAGTGATGQSLANLGDVFRKVYSTVPATIESASTAIADLNTKANLTGKALEDVSIAVLELSRLTGSNLNSIIDSSSKLFMNWRISADQMVSTLDFLFKVSQSTGVSIDQLNSNIASYGSVLREFGFSIEEAATMIGQFSKEGVELDKVMTGLRIALTEFAKAGISDATGALKEVIAQIKNAGTEAEANAVAIEVFGSRAGTYLAQQIREGRLEWDAFLRTLQTSSETIHKAETDTESLGEKFDILKQKVSLALEPIGKSFVDIIEQYIPKLTNAVESLSRTWESLGSTGQKALIGIAGTLAIGGPLLIGLGAVINALKTIVGLFGAVGTAAAALMPAVVLLGGEFYLLATHINDVAKALNQAEGALWSYQKQAQQSGYTVTPGAMAMPSGWITPTLFGATAEYLEPATGWGYGPGEPGYSGYGENIMKIQPAIQSVTYSVNELGVGLSSVNEGLAGSGEAAEEAIVELTAYEKLIRAIAADTQQFKPLTATELNLMALKSMSEQYKIISDQAENQWYFESKLAEERERQTKALKEMVDLMSASQPAGGLYSSFSELLDSIISKYQTLIRQVQAGAPYVEPQWNIAQANLLAWLQSGQLDRLLESLAQPFPRSTLENEALITRFELEFEKVLKQSNKELFESLGLTISFDKFSQLPQEIQNAIMKIAQLKELQDQAAQMKEASNTQLNAANIMLTAAQTLARAVPVTIISTGGSQPGGGGGGGGRPAVMAQYGALISQPSLVIAGESGPEWILPEAKLRSLFESAKSFRNLPPITIKIYSQEGKVQKATAQYEAQAFAEYGVIV